MEGIATDLAKQGAEKLIDKAIKELRYVCCYTCIADDFEKQKKRLKAERATVEQRIQVAKRKGEEIQANASYWEGQADELIKEDTKTKVACFPNFITRYRRGRELSGKTEEITKLVDEGKTFENVGLPPLPPGVERYSSQNYISFQSRESKYNELLDALKDDNNYIIGLQGMGGTGKTTLAKEAGKQLMQLKQFDHVIDTTVSATPVTKMIQDDIAVPLGLKWEDCTESERPKKLWSRLTNGDRILLILDDVWDRGDVNFEEIGIPSNDNHKGFRLLMTTRSIRVCYLMGCERSIIQLDVLSNDEALIMFKTHAGITDSSSKILVDKGREIANECKGLPVAIAVIASSLKGQQHKEEWDIALKSLQEPLMSEFGVDDNSVEIFKCLKFSYDNMKDGRTKALFLLFSVFPEDTKVPDEHLIIFGIGAGLFGEVSDKYDDVRNQVIVARNRLIDSCLLKYDNGFVSMHDLVREAALWIANKEIQVVNLSNKTQKSLLERENGIKYLSCTGKDTDIFSSRINSSKLEILNIFMDKDEDDSVQVPSSFFKNMKRLRVLFISSNGMEKECRSLTQSIGSLVNIQSLFFKNLMLDISILGNLQSLETLEFSRCFFNASPHEIAKLEKLRLLRLVDCDLDNLTNMIEKFPSLEELHITQMLFGGCGINSVHQLRTPLRRYSIITRNDYRDTHEYDYISKRLSLSASDNQYLSEAAMKYFMQTAEDLKLWRCTQEWGNLIPEIVPMEEGMNDLVLLHLMDSFPQLRCLIDTRNIDSQVHNVFSKLVELKLFKMDNLKELCDGPFPSDFLKSLRKLAIVNCQQLQQSMSQSLVLLEELIIEDCWELKNIITCETTNAEWGEEIVDDGDDKENQGSMFPNLKVLSISSCPQLQVILPFLSARDVPLLEVINISECDELKYIFGKYQHEHGSKYINQELHDVVLGSLKLMNLKSVPNFIGIFPEAEHLMCSSVKRSSSSKVQMQSEPIKCNIFPWHILRTKIPLELDSKNQSKDCSISTASNSDGLQHQEHTPTPCLTPCPLKQLQNLHNIKEINLCDLLKIKSLFILSVTQTMLLESLTIDNCEELKDIITSIGDCGDIISGGDVFPKLKYLSVNDCEQLEYIFGGYSHGHQNNKDIDHLHLPALKRVTLKKLSSFMCMSSDNYCTTSPLLEEFTLAQCPKYSFTSFGQMDSINMKDQRGEQEYILSLKNRQVYKPNSPSLFGFHEMIGQQITLQLRKIVLGELSPMMYFFVGPKNSFVLQNLLRLVIVGCEKLEIIFSTSTSRSLPQLRLLRVGNCKELKQIIEEDAEDREISKTCFPKLEVLVVESCNKLKCVFPISMPKVLPELRVVCISRANELEEVFGGEGDKKVVIPKLMFVTFVNLPSLCQENQFQTVKDRLVQNCPKLSLTSAMSKTGNAVKQYINSMGPEIDMEWEFIRLYNQLIAYMDEHHDEPDVEVEDTQENTNTDEPDVDIDDSKENIEMYKPEYSITEDVDIDDTKENINIDEPEHFATKDVEVEASQENTSIDEPKHSTVENIHVEDSEEKIETEEQEYSTTRYVDVKDSQENTNTDELEHSAVQDVDVEDFEENIEIDEPEYFATNDVDVDVEDSQENTNIDELEHSAAKVVDVEDTEENIDIDESEHSTTKDIDVPDSQENTNTDESEHFSTNDVDIIIEDSQENTKTNETEHLVAKDVDVEDFEQNIDIDEPGNPSQITKELEQVLSSKKSLTSENLTLLVDFLVKHPYVRLTGNSLSNRYKGYAYSCLAELLKFLQTHSLLDVLGSSHTEFLELLHDVRRFGFDKDWLDGVERRTLFPGLQVSHDALQNLLDSKRLLTQHLEDLKHQMMESITQQEVQVLEARAALSAPLGY